MVDVQTAGPRGEVRAGIVGAAAHLLREQGASAMTTRAVAQAAGVQAPTIYRLFGDKDGLVDAVAEHVMATYVAEESAAVTEADGDPIEDLRLGWRTHLEFGLANPELYALLSAPGRQQRSPSTADGFRVLRARVHRLASAGLLRVDEARAVRMIHSAGSGAVLTLLGSAPGERDPGLADAMFDAVLAGILATSPVVPDASTASIAVAFSAILPSLPALTQAERAVMQEWLARALAAL